MKLLSYIDYCGLPRWKQFFYKIYEFFYKVVLGLWHFIKGFGIGVKNFVFKVGRAFKKMYQSFRYGDVFTKLSFGLLGLSHVRRGQYVKGILMMILEALFIVFMVVFGGNALVNLVTLGDYRTGYICNNVIYETREEASAAGCRVRFWPFRTIRRASCSMAF